jgi:hypothetical protein
MKRTFVFCALVSSLMATNLFATAKNDFQSATVVSVQDGIDASLNNGASSDAPLRADSHSYNVGILLGDVVYRATYNSAFEDVSPVFATNQPVQAVSRGNVLYVSLPGNRVIAMAIASRTAKHAGVGNLSN